MSLLGFDIVEKGEDDGSGRSTCSPCAAYVSRCGLERTVLAAVQIRQLSEGSMLRRRRKRPGDWPLLLSRGPPHVAPLPQVTVRRYLFSRRPPA
ncbi:Os01g0193800 [Oryza sativa Japonica Group]|nr:Os01g0193800 [Oryza sativa Japonica Group]